MEKTERPVLCGGTFFTLLLEAANSRLKKRKTWGDKNVFTEADVLCALIKVAFPTYLRPNDDDNLGSVVSAYKSCNTSKSGRLGVFEQATKSTFDSKIKSDYRTPLAEMSELISSYIDTEGKGEWLVKALLELVGTDTTIRPEQEFYICEDGGKMTKAALRDTSDFCLPTFLLGIWHFIVFYISDNAVGKSTYDSWCPQGETKNGKRPFQSSIGRGTRTLNISPNAKCLEYEVEHAEDTDNADEPFADTVVDSYYEAEENESSANTTQILYNGTPITVIAQKGGVGIGVNTAPITINNH